MPRLDTPEGQAAVEPSVENADLIFIDNRSTLFNPEGEKDPSAWQPAQDWLLSLRRRRKTTFLVHHGNRQGGARGHGKPEDVMNLIIKLSRPDDYRTEEGARFRVEFEKNRGAYGGAVTSFTTQLTTSGWEIEHESAEAGTVGKLREYLRLAAAAGEYPKSASAAIRGARVNKSEGLRTWAEMLKAGDIEKTTNGFQSTERGSAVPRGSGTFTNRQNRFYGSQLFSWGTGELGENPPMPTLMGSEPVTLKAGFVVSVAALRLLWSHESRGLQIEREADSWRSARGRC